MTDNKKEDKTGTFYIYNHMQNNNYFNLLGVKIDNLSKIETLEKIKYFLNEKKFHQIATVNPEFILLAQKDKEFKKILNCCDLNIVDGFGIKLALWILGKKMESRITGIDLMLEILKIANQNKSSVFLAASNKSLSDWKETCAAILKIYPHLKISGADLNKDTANYKLSNINYDILFCNFGAPYQEKFINSLKDGNIKLAMGVGGSFDFITGKIKRAPLWMRNIGMEWLWRLILEPRYRFKRVLNATAVFMWKVIFKKVI